MMLEFQSVQVESQGHHRHRVVEMINLPRRSLISPVIFFVGAVALLFRCSDGLGLFLVGSRELSNRHRWLCRPSLHVRTARGTCPSAGRLHVVMAGNQKGDGAYKVIATNK